MTCISQKCNILNLTKKKQGDCNKLYYYNILNVISFKKRNFFQATLK